MACTPFVQATAFQYKIKQRNIFIRVNARWNNASPGISIFNSCKSFVHAHVCLILRALLVLKRVIPLLLLVF